MFFLLVEICFGKTKFYSKFVWGGDPQKKIYRKKSGLEIFLVSEIFLGKKKFSRNNFGSKKIIMGQKRFGSEIVFGSKKLGSKILLGQKKCGSEFFWSLLT